MKTIHADEGRIVDRGARTGLRRAIPPAAARGEHLQDARNDLPVVLALGTGLIDRHERPDHRRLFIRKPEKVHH